MVLGSRSPALLFPSSCPQQPSRFYHLATTLISSPLLALSHAPGIAFLLMGSLVLLDIRRRAYYKCKRCRCHMDTTANDYQQDSGIISFIMTLEVTLVPWLGPKRRHAMGLTKPMNNSSRA